jgi:membrane fusion protein (multidrug efflux system)
MKLIKLTASFLFTLGLCGLPLAAVAQGLPAEVITVKTQQLDKHISAVGVLRANESIMLQPEQSGRIEKILFTEGEQVQKGATLFQLDSAIYQAELKETQARVQLSKTDYDRATSLLKKRVGSVQDRDSALAQLRVNQAQEALARTRLEKMTLTAPFSGYTGLRTVSPGDFVTAGQTLVELTDISTLKMDFRVPEIYLSLLQPGREIAVIVDALPGEVIKGEVYAVSPSSDASAHNIAVLASLPNPDGRLRPGLFAQVNLLVEQTQSVVIPEQAIIPQDGSFMVMRLGAEHKVEIVPVKLGQRRPGVVHIIEGVQAGDLLVVSGQIKLQPGMPVTPIFIDGSQKTTDQQG